MRKFALLLFAVALLLAAPLQAAEATAHGLSAGYAHDGLAGQLTIVNAEGQSFVAINSAGQVVAAGTVTGGWFSVPANNSGPDAQGRLLRVTVGSQQMQFSGTEWWFWE